MAEKVAAALHWPISAPYYAPSGVGDQLFAFEVTAVTVLGTASLLYMPFKHGLRSATLAGSVAPVVWLGALATIVTASPETRFALPLVLFGIAGCAALLRSRPRARWVAAAVIAVLVVFAIGVKGLAHEASPGGVSRLFAVGRGGGWRGRVVKDSWPWAEMGVEKTSTRTRTTSRERAYGLAA